MFTIALAIVVLIVALVIPANKVQFMVKPESQIVLGTIVVAVLLFDKALSGLILGIAVLVMFMRAHAGMFGVNLDIMSLLDNKQGSGSRSRYDVPFGQQRQGGAAKSLVMNKPYITPENLVDAQNNIFSPQNFAQSMVGFTGVYGEPVYGAQGADKLLPGFDSYAPGSAVKR